MLKRSSTVIGLGGRESGVGGLGISSKLSGIHGDAHSDPGEEDIEA